MGSIALNPTPCLLCGLLVDGGIGSFELCGEILMLRLLEFCGIRVLSILDKTKERRDNGRV